MSLRELVITGWLYGRDGDEGEGDSKAKGQEPAPDGQEPPVKEDEESSDGDDTGDDKPISKAAATKLRKENQELRRRAKAAESEAGEFKKAQMSDLERAETERDEALVKAETATSGAASARLEAAVLAKAAAFVNPTEALALIDLSAIVIDDDGKPDGRSVASAITKLAKDSPHLLKPGGSGSGDGGPTGTPKPETMTAKIDEHEKTLLEGGGMVKMPEMGK